MKQDNAPHPRHIDVDERGMHQKSKGHALAWVPFFVDVESTTSGTIG